MKRYVQINLFYGGDAVFNPLCSGPIEPAFALEVGDVAERVEMVAQELSLGVQHLSR